MHNPFCSKLFKRGRFKLGRLRTDDKIGSGFYKKILGKEVVMSYQDAIRQFQENIRLVDATNDSLTWNLNAGLANLTEALSQDLATIRNSLQTIAEMLRRG